MEEANRYAGGYSDPARLVTAFAGVAGNSNDNGVSVHGNAPQSMQWKLEGVEIYSPNHFTDAFNMGTGVVSALNSNVLDNSDFYLGAFTAEYGNALSGVFDMRMRAGNNEKYEHAAQIGTLGLEGTSEGPIGKKGKASYLINYRYSLTTVARELGLLSLDGDQADFQDINFKFNLPTKNAGTFSIFGVGLRDKYWLEVIKPAKWHSVYDQEYDICRQTMLVGGVGHKIYLGKGWNLNSTVAASYFKNKGFQGFYTKDEQDPNRLGELQPYVRMNQNNSQLTFTTNLQKRFSNSFLSKIGATYTEYFFDIDLKMTERLGEQWPDHSVYTADSHTGLLNTYISNSWNISRYVTFNFGLTSQYFRLNNDFTVEPRAALQWNPDAKNTFSIGYGMHSKTDKMDVYFVNDPEKGYVNKDLKLSRAHHIVASYIHRFSDDLNLRVEGYYQYLYKLPIEAEGSYCTINRRYYYEERALVSEGKGRNYGIDVTLEHYMHNGYYWLVDGSLYKSEYKTNDNIWRNTRYNRTYMLKVLGGKEWIMGAKKRNVLSVNGKFTLQGGQRYTPADVETSKENYLNGIPQVAYFEDEAFSRQYNPCYIIDLTVSYKIGGRKVSHTIAFEALNLLQKKVPYENTYNYVTGRVESYDSGLSLPNLYYRINF
ncbi:MAG: TonB-dependent receptor plug domain-containing protein [Prevotella sp.]